MTTQNKSVRTAGPWYEMTKGENEYQSQVCQESTGKTVALTYTGNDADARLIAAAPELLEALKDLLANCECIQARHRPNGILEARAAISKADGRQD
jgi:hypothetical protein